jgi:methanethiol S-methyltransferase
VRRWAKDSRQAACGTYNKDRPQIAEQSAQRGYSAPGIAVRWPNEASPMKYTALIMLWIIWCVIHSSLISSSLNKHVKNRLERYYKFYRLFYNLVALATLIPLILYSQNLKGPVLSRWEGYMTFVQLLLLTVAITLFIAGGLKYDILQFSGIRQIRSGKSHSALSESGEINTTGILSVTRHPWYLAAMILVWVDYREMYVSKLIVNIVLTGYLIVGTILEERRLMIEFGDSYRDYMGRVSMLLPTKWLFSKLLTVNNTNSVDS